MFAVLALAIGIGSLATVEPQPANAAAVALPELAKVERSPGSQSLPAGGTFAPLVKEAAPAVVSVQAVRTAKAPRMPQGFPFFDPRGEQPERRQRGLGSGVIVSQEGYILTNHHVVEDADDVKVMLLDERELAAEIVGSDAKTDIAVLKVDAADLPVLKLGNSDAVEVGDLSLAIGNPFGIGQTVTMGIVGATGRQFMNRGGYEDFIQTDAAINPGNSGGALINTRGELIGINTAILSRSGGNNGVGFAVPINLAHHVMTQLVNNGRVVRGYMGVGIQDVTPQMAKTLEIPDAKGAVVTAVEPNGPADEAGFQPYDVIRDVNGAEVETSQELRLEVANTPPGESVDVTVLRDGEERTLAITLGELPGNEAPTRQESRETGALSGVSVENLTPEIASRLGLEADAAGVVVTRVARGSAAAEAGLRPGDVIQEVARQPVRSVADFRKALRDADDEAVLLLVQSRGGSRFVVIEP